MNKYLKLKQIFEENEDKNNAITMAAYMRNKFQFYGLATPKRKSLYNGLLKDELRNKCLDWELLDKCYEDEHREFQYFVIDYLRTMKKFLQYSDITKIKRYVKDKQWWDTIDGFDTIIGDIAFKDKRVDDLMLKWSLDNDFWLRRIAIDHQLSRKEKTNTELLEKIIVNNFGSDEFFINKAIGWSLRDYSKTNPNWVKCFVTRYKDKLNKLSLKEAIKYL